MVRITKNPQCVRGLTAGPRSVPEDRREADGNVRLHGVGIDKQDNFTTCLQSFGNVSCDRLDDQQIIRNIFGNTGLLRVNPELPIVDRPLINLVEY